MKKFLILLTAICVLEGITSDVQAHWRYSHQYFAEQALQVFADNGFVTFVSFLNSPAPAIQNGDSHIQDCRTYLDCLKNGLRDADLRAEGIYGVDKHCSVLGDDDCGDRTNNIKEMIVGDHQYNPYSRTGYHGGKTAPELIERVERDFPGWYASENELISLLTGSTQDEKLASLKQYMREADAAMFAEYFFSEARREHEQGRIGMSMYYLGMALHAVQDLTVPHHSHISKDGHESYEKYMWETYLQKGTQNIPLSSGTVRFYLLFSARLDPKTFVISNSLQSFNWDLNNPSTSAAKSARIAVLSTAGFLAHYFSVIKLNDTFVGSIACSGRYPVLFFNVAMNLHIAGTFDIDFPGNDYDGTPIYFNISGSNLLNRLSFVVSMYWNNNHANLFRRDSFEGEIIDGYFFATGELIEDIAADCDPLDLEMHKYGSENNSFSQSPLFRSQQADCLLGVND